jgi:hypothetical protein
LYAKFHTELGDEGSLLLFVHFARRRKKNPSAKLPQLLGERVLCLLYKLVLLGCSDSACLALSSGDSPIQPAWRYRLAILRFNLLGVIV